MRTILICLLYSVLGSTTFAQQTINASIQHDGLTRDYILYIPEIYSGNEAVPLVFNFHGYGSNAGQQLFYGEFRPIADTAGFILVVPEGTVYQGSTHWNVGGWTTGSTVDDVGFVDALLDTLIEQYAIDAHRIYSTGMSNGGFMSYLLACQLSDRFTAVASVTGSMTPETINNCAPSHPTPILQIHGTADDVVPYTGALWTQSVEDVLDYWVQYNACTSTPTLTEIPNTNTTDGTTAEQYVYANGNQGVEVEHFKIIDGAHTWPGAPFAFPGTNYDIDASVEIWRFFAQWDLAMLNTTQIEEVETPKNTIQIAPNPTDAVLHFNTPFEQNNSFTIINTVGQTVLEGILQNGATDIDIRDLETGTYFIFIEKQLIQFMKR